ncbi:hypothetical protein ACS0TY_011394 [Phlomoides rotata]
MEGGGSSCLGLNKNGKNTNRNCRAWTPDLVTKGWRTENGFKPGYLQKLEMGMVRKLPGTDIHVIPHITSRITIWKKFHGSLQTMLGGNSGIGFNTVTGMIDCHNDAWALIVKVQVMATVRRLEGNIWNGACKWAIIEDVTQAVNNLQSEETSQGGIQNETNVEMNLTDPDPAVDLDITSEAPAVYDLDVGNARNEVFSVLDGIADITEDENVDAAH